MSHARLTLLLAALAGACSPGTPAKPARAVRVETVGAASSAGRAHYGGVVRAQTQVDLAFRVGGFVASIATAPANGANRGKASERLVQAGDRVAKGTVLATLRQADYRQRLSEANAMSAEASASYRHAKADYARDKKLFADGAISRAEYDGARARFEALAGGAGAAASRSGQMKLTLEDTRLRAPLDGIVLERTIEIGALVGSTTPAFVLADTSTVRVTFGVPDGAQRALSLGTETAVTTDAVPDRTFVAVITKIAAQADPKTRVFDVEASIDNREDLLKVGMPATVDVERRSLTAAAPAVIPLSALVRRPGDGDGFTVFVLNATAAPSVSARWVQLGPLTGNRVAVTKGLRTGERIVVQGASFVSDGESVLVVPTPGAS